MRKRIRMMLTGLALSLPLLTAVGSVTILRGASDGVVLPAPAVRPLAKGSLRAGHVEPSTGVPCRRSAGDRLDIAPQPKSLAGPNTGCTLRLVKRKPADMAIWV